MTARITPLLLEAWSLRRGDRRRALAASLAPLGAPALYALYWLVHAGDALRPFHAQDSWSRTLALPLITLGNGLWLGVSGITDARGIYWTVDLVLTAAVLTALAFRWRVIPKPYLIYVFASLVLIFSYPLPARPLLSVPRFVAVLFPVFWAMSALFTGRRLPIALTVSGIGLAAMAVAFMNWGFIF